MKPTLSVAIATFNEEKNIKNCLNNIYEWVDEIILVDGKSSDQTLNIAKKFKNIRILEHENQEMFHINKNLAIDNCKSEWILFLDADEIVNEGLRQEILKAITSDPSKTGFYIPRKNFFLNRFLTKGGQYPDERMRLFKNGKGKWPCVTVHEQIEVTGNLGYLQNPLIHLADPEFSRYLARSNRYTTLEAINLLKEKQDSLGMMVKYVFFKPLGTFLNIFVRHKGFLDGFPGFIFALYSGIHWISSYIKFWEKRHENSNKYITAHKSA